MTLNQYRRNLKRICTMLALEQISPETFSRLMLALKDTRAATENFQHMLRHARSERMRRFAS